MVGQFSYDDTSPLDDSFADLFQFLDGNTLSVYSASFVFVGFEW